MENFKNAALLLVDIQQGLEDAEFYGGVGGERNNPQAEQNCRLLLDHWRASHSPVFHIYHCSTNPDSPLREGKPGNAIKEIVKPAGDEPVLKKNVNSAFIGTDLRARLDKAGIKTVVVVGLTTDHCISTTVRMAANLGYKTYLVADATAAFSKTGIKGEHYSSETTHLTALAHLNEEFATVLNTDELLDLVK